MQAMWTELKAWELPIGLVSGVLMAISLFLTPYIVSRLPVDYFIHEQHHTPRKNRRHPAIGFVLDGIKNVLGALLLVLGLLMLPGPGPSFIIIAFGLSMMNFPGKYRLKRRVAGHPWILRDLNAIRRKHGQPPFIGLH